MMERRLARYLLAALSACNPSPKANTHTIPTQSSVASAPPRPTAAQTLPQAPIPAPTVEVVPLDPTQQPVTFVLRGTGKKQPMVFLAGMCGHAQYYVQSFQESAARWGVVVAPQGENLCGAGPYSTLSGDPKKLDRRILQAFTALSIPDPKDVLVIGYSLGATHAQTLARLWPERYTRLVLIAAPQAPTPYGLKAVRGTVMLAGSKDRKDLMLRGVTLMKQAGIRSKFLELPGAHHGEMGTDAERVMEDALTFVLE